MMGTLIAGNSTAHHSTYPDAVNSDMTSSPNQSSSPDPLLVVFFLFDVMRDALRERVVNSNARGVGVAGCDDLLTAPHTRLGVVTSAGVSAHSAQHHWRWRR
ncbi:Uncharacterised protein [Mycobacteroides abscessus subsp. abscessus]|nr:Uncharacterised protein [Mycobacteroides abscessus subsp. abscessus]SKT17810.1 Uncharacterised protein [Mycobacteroides abscessus subsp. abscessus]